MLLGTDLSTCELLSLICLERAFANYFYLQGTWVDCLEKALANDFYLQGTWLPRVFSAMVWCKIQISAKCASRPREASAG